jgi:hypothetical protein
MAVLAWAAEAPPQAVPVKPAAPEYRLSKAVQHDNLTIFFLVGADQLKGQRILTLDEALRDRKVIVHETKNVNELAIENVSGEAVFVQAGDIVKGGQQDRVLALDGIIQPKSGKLPISSFCVEQGRWAARGGEDSKKFSRSQQQLIGNDLKIAARSSKSQRGVWKEVAEQQKKLMMATGKEVKDAQSSTSLQLTLENKNVAEAIEVYRKKLEGQLPPTDDGNVIGYAVVINGKVMSADIYANSDLFRRLWPKLVRASILEAVADRKAGGKVPAVKAKDVEAFLADAAAGKKQERAGLADQREEQRDSKDNVYFETKSAKDGTVLRRSYLAK